LVCVHVRTCSKENMPGIFHSSGRHLRQRKKKYTASPERSAHFSCS
jgi:hypothetical protein